MKITVKSSSGKELGVFDVEKVDELKKEFAKKNKKFADINRQRFYYVDGQGKNVSLNDGLFFNILKVPNNTVVFKDLGPQISWKTVFLTEYAGPLFVMLALYSLRKVIFGSVLDADTWNGYVQNLGVLCWSAHYIKRLLETQFVHRFSHATMPIMNIFKNSFYYWGAAALVGYFLVHPLYTAPASNQVYTGLAIFVVSELCNLKCHLMLRDLRPAGTNKRAVPRGFFFELVSCPNYFFEVLAWVGFTIMTQMVGALLFTIVGFFQMMVWAQGKHRNYIKEFDGKEGRESYPRSRKAIIPFIL